MELFKITQMQAEDLLFQKDPAEAVHALRGGDRSADPRRLEDAAKRFEGLLMHQLLKQMKETAEQLEPEEDEESGDKSSGEHIKSMFWTFLGDAVTQQGGVGLWEKIYDQMASQAGSGKIANLVELDERI